MKLDRNLLQPAGNPGTISEESKSRQLAKIALPVTFGDQNNCRTEHITFGVVDMHYSYYAIFERGTTNIFSAALHPGYLCMKLPAAKGIITIYGDQDSTRAAEGTTSLGQRNVHALDKERNNIKESSPEETKQADRV